MRLTGPVPPTTAMSDCGVARSPRPRSAVWHGGAQEYGFQRPPTFTDLDRPCSSRMLQPLGGAGGRSGLTPPLTQPAPGARLHGGTCAGPRRPTALPKGPQKCFRYSSNREVKSELFGLKVHSYVHQQSRNTVFSVRLGRKEPAG